MSRPALLLLAAGLLSSPALAEEHAPGINGTDTGPTGRVNSPTGPSGRVDSPTGPTGRVDSIQIRDVAQPPARPGEQRLHFKVSHKHSRAEAKARTQYLFEYWKKRFGVSSKWDGDKGVATGNIMGISFTAWFEVTDTSVAGDATDPGFFTRGIAYAYIDKKLKKYMHPDYDDP